MAIRIKDAINIDVLQDYLMIPVGNTDEGKDGKITLGQMKDFVDADKAVVAFTGSYLNLTDVPNLESYVLMTTLQQNYYTRAQVNNLVDSVSGPVYEKVEELPEKGENNVIYLIPDETTQHDNIFDEYIWIPDGKLFEKIGSTRADFNNYYTIEEVDALIPSVGNGTITINQGGVKKGTFTVNQSGNTVINLDEGGGTQVQSDWDVEDPTAVDYIKNKPKIPTVNDPTITINQGGVNKGSFTLNQGNTTTINLDSVSQVQSDWNEDNPSEPSFILNKPVIPTVNNPTITFTQGGVTVGSISLNQSSGATIAFTSGGTGAVQSNWAESDSTSLAFIQNKPEVPSNTRSLLVTYDNDTTETIVVYVQ